MNCCGMPSGHFDEGSKTCQMMTFAGEAISISCPAKLNIFLEILGKRSDGFHELETVMLRTQFADQLTVRKTCSSEVSLRFSDATPEPLRAGVPLTDRNLILQAANRLREYLGIGSGGEFVLHKRIPPESGLGGGSSNAASALLLCRQMWKPDLSDAILHQIAASLGSDINFLLSGYPAAVCRGRGEILEPIPLRNRYSFVALRPRRGNSTAEIFRNTSFSKTPENSSAIVATLAGDESRGLSKQIFNRLTAAAVLINPEMATLMAQLARLIRRPVFMSGSGSTVFLLAQSHSDAMSLQRSIWTTMRQRSWLLNTVSNLF